MKGVILAGGYGTRLHPLTSVIGKQLLPVFDKPMIYYPLSTLIHAGAKEILIVSTKKELPNFKDLLGNGDQFGVDIKFIEQVEPKGLADGVKLAEEFVGDDSFWFILGDNLFHGPEFGKRLGFIPQENNGCTIFAYRVKDPSSYGVIKFDLNEQPIEIIEKPEKLISNWAVPGIYHFNNEAFKLAKSVSPSLRGEYEITSILNLYIERGNLSVKKISRGNTWFDLGTSENLLSAANFVQAIQERQGLLIGSPEEASLYQ